MSDVIYLPAERRETLGSDIGGLLGAYIGQQMQLENQRRLMQQQQMFLEGIRRSPSRAAAFETISNFSPMFKSPKDYASAFEMVDKMHPISEDTPTQVTAYKPDTGEPTTVFATRKDLQNPDAFFGSRGLSLTKPDLSDFYKPVEGSTADNPQYQRLGKLPTAQRPEGAVTLSELELLRKDAADKRAERRDVRQEEAGNRAQQALTAALDRSNRTAADMSARMSETEAQHAQRTMGSVRSLLALTMNAKQLPDGSFSFGDDINKQETFIKRLDYITAKVDANPSILKKPTAVEALVSDASRSVGAEKVQQPEPPPKKKGLFERVFSSGGDNKEVKKPEPTMSAADQKASLENAKAAAARVRNSATMNLQQKKDALATIRKTLKDNGIRDDSI